MLTHYEAALLSLLLLILLNRILLDDLLQLGEEFATLHLILGATLVLLDLLFLTVLSLLLVLLHVLGLKSVVHRHTHIPQVLLLVCLLVLQTALNLSLASSSLLMSLLLGELALSPQFLVVDGEDLPGRLALAGADPDGQGLLHHDGRHVLGGDGCLLEGGLRGEVLVAHLVQLVE